MERFELALITMCVSQGLSQKSKVQLEALRKLADHARNYHEYRSRLRNTAPPAVPFLGELRFAPMIAGFDANGCTYPGLYLTDITFCREGNPSHRTSPKAPEKKLLNFNKYHKLARIVQGMKASCWSDMDRRSRRRL